MLYQFLVDKNDNKTFKSGAGLGMKRHTVATAAAIGVQYGVESWETNFVVCAALSKINNIQTYKYISFLFV